MSKHHWPMLQFQVTKNISILVIKYIIRCLLFVIKNVLLLDTTIMLLHLNVKTVLLIVNIVHLSSIVPNASLDSSLIQYQRLAISVTQVPIIIYQHNHANLALKTV